MKIKLVKIHSDLWDAYKNKPYKYCCEKMKDKTKQGVFKLGRNDLTLFPEYLLCRQKYKLNHQGQFVMTGDELTKIDYCPYCGEKIEFEVVEEKDVCNEANDIWQELRRFKDGYTDDDLQYEYDKLTGWSDRDWIWENEDEEETEDKSRL